MSMKGNYMQHIKNLFSTAHRIELTGEIVGFHFEKESNLHFVTVRTDDGENFSAPSVNIQGFYQKGPPTETKVHFCFVAEGFEKPVAIVTG